MVGDRLLILSLCHRKPNGLTSIDTLACWVKQMMIAAGIDSTVFQPHSCQAASTSKANSAGVPLHEILRAGQWSQDSTFFTAKDSYSQQ